MSNLQAAVGLGQIEIAEKIIQKKKDIYKWYKEELKGIPEFKFQDFGNSSSHISPWVFAAISDNSNIIQLELKKNEWDTRTFFFPLNEMPVFKSYKYFTNLNVSNFLSPKGVIYPSSCHLKRDQINEICNFIKNVI